MADKYFVYRPVTSAFTRLRIDVDKVRADNLLKTDVKRKSGLIIKDGGVLKPEERERQRKENVEKYGVDQVAIHARKNLCVLTSF